MNQRGEAAGAALGRGTGLSGVLLAVLLLVAASVALAPGVTLETRGDAHAEDKHGTTALDVIQRDWDPQQIEVYISLQRQTVALARRQPTVMMLTFVGVREKIAMAEALLRVTPTWPMITALVDGSLELTHYPMRHKQWARVQARDGYVRVWPVAVGQ